MTSPSASEERTGPVVSQSGEDEAKEKNKMNKALEWLREQRENRGMSQQAAARALAALVGNAAMSAAQWGNYERSKTPVSVEKFTQLAAAIGVDPKECPELQEELVEPESRPLISVRPSEFNRALERWKTNKLDSIAWPRYPEELVCTLNLRYGTEKIVNMQAKLVDELKRACTEGNLKSMELKSSHPSRPMEIVHETMLRPEIPDYLAAICPFPFFLSPSREPKWGVLPYCHHVRLGVVVAKDHKMVETLTGLDGKSVPTVNWALDLLKAAKDNNTHVVAARGYIHFEIMRQLVLDQPNQDNRELFFNILSHFAPHELITSGLGEAFGVVFPSDSEEAYTEDTSKSKTADKAFAGAAVVFELEQRQDIEKKLNTRGSDWYRIFAVPHGLRVPVGIGFSLRAVPILLENDLWSRLLTIAVQEMGTPEGKQALYDLGLDYTWVDPQPKRI